MANILIQRGIIGMNKTIGQIRQEYNLDRGTLLKAAKVQHLLGNAAKKSGHIWLIDDESEQFKTWLARHLANKGAFRKSIEAYGE